MTETNIYVIIMGMNKFDIKEILNFLPNRYPFLLVDRVLDFEDRKKIVCLKNVSINESCFQGHYPENPIFPEVLILESLIQSGSVLMLKDSEFSGRFTVFEGLDNVTFKKPVLPGDQLRLEVEILKLSDSAIKMRGMALVEGKVVCEGTLLFSLKMAPSRPQIHPTASVHPSAILGKDVVIGPNTIIGEHVTIGDRTVFEGHVLVEKWTRIGEDCQIHFGCVLGSSAQDAKYKGETSWVVIGDRNVLREYVTINRGTGKESVTKVGSDNTFLTHVHLAHNCQVGNNITIANMTNIAGHTHIEDNVMIGGMTGIHQFVRIGTGAMVGAYTRLPQDVPPFMICEGNPAIIRGLNVIGLRRNKASRETMAELKDIYKRLYRSDENIGQAIENLESKNMTSPQAKKALAFIKESSSRGITKKQQSDEA